MGHDPYGPLGQPTTVRGRPTRLQLATVSVINPDATIDVRLTRSRANRHRVPVFGAVMPAVGDQVLLAELDGDPNTPIALSQAKPPPTP